MADFDQFESSEPPKMEDDPAADFLAREQNELAGLEDDNPVDSTGTGGDFGSFGDDSSAVNTNEGDLFGGDLNNDVGGSSDLQNDVSFGQSDGLLDMGDSLSGQSNGLLDMDSAPPSSSSIPTNGPSDTYSAISQVDTLRSEPEKIRVWREQQKERLETKDTEEEKKKAEWQSIAKKELEDWYKHHAEQLTKTHENNLAAEKAFIKERDETTPGNEWEKISRLCEFNPKHAKSSKDVTRMRSILLQLKQTPLVR